MPIHYRPLTSFDLRPPIPTDNPYDALNDITEPEDTRIRYQPENTRIRYQVADLKKLQFTSGKPNAEQQAAIDELNLTKRVSQAAAGPVRAASHNRRHKYSAYAHQYKRPHYHHTQSAHNRQKIEDWFRSRREDYLSAKNK